jgi:hypothetical protein
MSKNQNGNKEAKKPKKEQPKPANPAAVLPVPAAVERGKKK